MGEAFDLATVAGMAGLGGSAVAGIIGALVFKGLILRIITQIIVTTALTVIGFIALLGFLGFEIVPKPQTPQVAAIAPPTGSGSFTTQSVRPAPTSTTTEQERRAEAEGRRVIRVKSPFRS